MVCFRYRVLPNLSRWCLINRAGAFLVRSSIMRSVALALALGVILAGCVGSDAKGVGDGTTVDPDVSALLRGLVISDELFPVVGADIAIDGEPVARTTEAGV